MKTETLRKIRDAITLYAADAPEVLKELEEWLTEASFGQWKIELGFTGGQFRKSTSRIHAVRFDGTGRVWSLCGYPADAWPVIYRPDPEVDKRANYVWARRKKCADCMNAIGVR